MDTHPPIPRHPLDPLSSAGPGKSATPSELPIPVFKCGILISYKDLLGLAPKKSLLPAISVAVSVICCAICHTIYGSPRLARKLKCDGGRPACGQCTKRSNSCDYMPQTKRRGARQRKGDESESESAEDKSADPDEPSPESSTLGKRNTKPAPVGTDARASRHWPHPFLFSLQTSHATRRIPPLIFHQRVTTHSNTFIT